jgi:poly(A) polymerase
MHEPSSKHTGRSESHDSLDDPRDHRLPPGLALDPPDDPPPAHPPEIPVDRLDADAIKVIARLRHMRHQAYFVGGCVRDLLLDRTPKDFDLATDAHPGEVRAIFRNCRLIGRRFRLAHVYFRGGKVLEVATFRKNPIDVADDVPDGGDLLITRDNVFGTAEEDAVRRDFTVNGLFYDVASGEVIDYVGGRKDLEEHRIATIGDPEIRMREDPVRALRAVRFASRLGFTIEPDCFEAMRRHAGELARCAPARVLEETFKILRCGGSARAFELLRACGALPVVLPALGAALDSWDDPRRRSFFAHLSALDRLVRSGEEVSDAVLLGALLMHLSGGGALGPAQGEGHRAPPSPPLAPGQPPPAAPPLATRTGPNDADALLASLVSTSRLPRKIAERARLALQIQRGLREPQRKRRRRGRGGDASQQVDAMQLLALSVEATGEGREVLDRVKALSRHDEPRGDRGGERHADDRDREDGEGAAPGEPVREPVREHADAGRHGGREARPETGRGARSEGREPGRGARSEGGREPGRGTGRDDAPDRGEPRRSEPPRHARRGAHPAAAPHGGRIATIDMRGREPLPERGATAVIEVDAQLPREGRGETRAASSDEGAPGGEGQPGGSKRRRRRGGRRRRRRGPGTDAPAGGVPPPPTEA